MICFIGFPLAVNISMITGCRNFTAVFNYFLAVDAPCIACIAFFTTSGTFCVTHFGVLVIGRINRTVLSLTYRTDSFFNTGGLAAGMMSFINDIAATNCLTLFPVIDFIRCPNGSRVVSVFRNRRSFFYLMIAGRAINIAGIAFCVAGGVLLSH